jgi:hypothetical protein
MKETLFINAYSDLISSNMKGTFNKVHILQLSSRQSLNRYYLAKTTKNKYKLNFEH